jgi:PiT family inorganic phosphate transporter
MLFLKLIPSLYLGWGLGSNDAANVFGPQVNSGTVKYRNAIFLASAFVIVGSVLEGRRGISTISGISDLALSNAIISTLAAAVTVNMMSHFGLPISTSQTVVGSIIGLSILNDNPLDYAKLTKVFICWILTPVGAIIFALIAYKFLAWLWKKRVRNLVMFNFIIKALSIIIGCYAAYSLGANNVANVIGTLAGANLLSIFWATILGGVSICLGILTYSKNVMYTVGKRITPLDPFSAMIVVFSEAVTLHIFALLGVPVSSSQAVVGAVVGVGLVKDTGVISRKTLILIFAGWLIALLGSALIAFIMGFVFRLF